MAEEIDYQRKSQLTTSRLTAHKKHLCVPSFVINFSTSSIMTFNTKFTGKPDHDALAPSLDLANLSASLF